MNAEHKLPLLLALRQQLHTEQLASRVAAVQASAEQLNARNNAYLERAKALLNPAEFEAVFGFSPDQKVTLGDPAMARNGGEMQGRES